MRKREPQGEWARYAYGYSDKKPGKAWWIIHGAMIVFIISQVMQVKP